jgi:hypothetical protein
MLWLAACGGSSGSSDPSATAGSAAPNVVPVTVGPGPAAAGRGTFNIPYTSVTVCYPGTTRCASIDHVLVDTGSFGLRLFASALAATSLKPPMMADPDDSANTLAECVPFVDGYIWGPLTVLKLKLGGETADSIAVHVIDDNDTFMPPVPPECTGLTSSVALNSVRAFDANGVLGIGLAAEDCGAICAQCDLAAGGCDASNDFYYSCNTNSGHCRAVPVAVSSQVSNPVVAFATDNNGVILELDAIAPTGAHSASGTLTFGIETQANNTLGNAVVLQADDRGFITAIFNGRTLGSSFIDSGSNGLYFDDASLPTCASNAAFYCPAATASRSAVLQGQQGTQSTVTFQIADLNSISASHYAIDDVGGKAPTSGGVDALQDDFDFGLPFFYGRRVFTAIAGTSAGGNPGPFFAY